MAQFHVLSCIGDTAGAIRTPMPSTIGMQRLRGQVESSDAWTRLIVSLALSTIGGVGMWSVVVALPTVQAEFGVARGAASLPYTLTMVSFGVSSILMGKLSDRFGIISPPGAPSRPSPP